MPKVKRPSTPSKGGIVIGYDLRNKHHEQLFYLGDDVHSMILGMTRSGKTRNMLLQSICFTGLANESMIISDPKGELYGYTAAFLRILGYEVMALDFKTPTKSHSYNFLQPIINMLKTGNTPKAVELIWDITSALVPTSNKGEPIWENGEASIIAGAIMATVYDNQDKPALQNMTNVYHFIAVMCQANEKGVMPLNLYVDRLPDDHPAKGLFAVAMTAPARTRGSFVTAALGKLKLFTSPYVYNMTSKSDFNLADVGSKKHAIFIILPDGRDTYNSLASLFVYQQYQALLENADSNGGRLKVRTNFMLEEFGNFTKIPSFTQMLTVGGGRGIRLNLVIQSFSQLDEKYGKENADTIRDNCHCLVYLHSENPNTNGDISKRLGKYTTSSYGRSNNTSSRSAVNSSASLNLIARDLLMPEEVKKIERPYVLVMYSGNDPAIMVMPDISQWFFNDMLGMGDKDTNQKVRIARDNQRKAIEQKPIELWQSLYSYKYEIGRVSEQSADAQSEGGYFNNNYAPNPEDFTGDLSFGDDYDTDDADDDASEESAEEVLSRARGWSKNTSS